jgi:glycerol uptake facilitator-like aquaporin
MQSPHARAWLSEFAGTALLLFASVLVTWWLFDPRSALAGAVPGLAGRKAIEGACIGLMIALLIISPLGRSSGGHFNPAVTVTLWLLRSLPGRDGAAYVAAQIVGSLVGLLLGWAALGSVMADREVDYAAIRPAAGWQAGAVFAGEAVSLAILMAAAVVFLARPALMRWTPLVTAAVVAVLILAGGLTTGGSFNPARQIGPLLLAGRFSYLWPYLLGPLVGAITVAALIQARGLRRPLTCSLRRAASLLDAQAISHPPPTRAMRCAAAHLVPATLELRPGPRAEPDRGGCAQVAGRVDVPAQAGQRCPGRVGPDLRRAVFQMLTPGGRSEPGPERRARRRRV